MQYSGPSSSGIWRMNDIDIRIPDWGTLAETLLDHIWKIKTVVYVYRIVKKHTCFEKVKLNNLVTNVNMSGTVASKFSSSVVWLFLI